MFKSKQRIQSAWAKGLMFGKAVGKRDERDRIAELLETYCDNRHDALSGCDCPNQISVILTGKEVEND